MRRNAGPLSVGTSSVPSVHGSTAPQNEPWFDLQHFIYTSMGLPPCTILSKLTLIFELLEGKCEYGRTSVPQ